MSGRFGVIGGGAWGTALAQTLASDGSGVVLWAREAEVVEDINTRHQNRLFLPGLKLSPLITAVTDLWDLADENPVLVVTPAQHMRAVLGQLSENAQELILCSKGIEAESHLLMHEVARDVLPYSPVAVLSGPTFAHEVAAGLPTAVTLACEDGEIAQRLAQKVARPAFRPYATDDVAGAEVGGAVKNVLAIACGVVEGRGLGRSAHAAVITRGFAELTRLAVALGGKAETVAGLCGLGDLVLTCSSPQSRNMSLGLALGRGETLDAALSGKLSVAEGAASAPAVRALAQKLDVETPICEAVAAVLAGERDLDEAIGGLLSRPLRPEREE